MKISPLLQCYTITFSFIWFYGKKRKLQNSDVFI